MKKIIFISINLFVIINWVSAQNTYSDLLNIPLTDNEFSGIYTSEIKLNKTEKKTVKIHVYETDINAYYRRPIKIAFGKVEILERKKNKGPSKSVLFDGKLIRKGNEVYLEINYIQDNGNNPLKLRKGSKLKFAKNNTPKIIYKTYSLGNIELLKIDGINSFSKMVEDYYLQKLKDRYSAGNLNIGRRSIMRNVYKDDEMVLYNYGIRGINISTKVNQLEDMFNINTIKANYSYSGNPNATDSNFYNTIKKETGKKINEIFSNKGSLVFCYLPNINKIELYNKGEHNFNAFVNRTNGDLSFVVKPTSGFESKVASNTERLIQKEEKEEQMRQNKLRAEKKKRQEQFEKEFEIKRSKLPLDERISMKDVMTDESNIYFFQYIYYGLFSKARNYHQPKSNYFSTLYCNFHILLSRKNSEYFQTNSDYSQITIRNEDQTREVWIEKRYASALKENVKRSKINYSNSIDLFSLQRDLNVLTKDMKGFVNSYNPKSPIMIRLRENLYRYSEGLDAL
ncbi:hypothetical protein GCM10023311_24800 [Flaviramulus aquimarinus]|uniref:Uncharacterized protein n=1 Tax=Flaviramulus aquimarinus TaxID=1170456 RepID=A0ABP9FDK3_9FLAO